MKNDDCMRSSFPPEDKVLTDLTQLVRPVGRAASNHHCRPHHLTRELACTLGFEHGSKYVVCMSLCRATLGVHPISWVYIQSWVMRSFPLTTTTNGAPRIQTLSRQGSGNPAASWTGSIAHPGCELGDLTTVFGSHEALRVVPERARLMPSG